MNKILLKRSVSLSLVLMLLVHVFYMSIEPIMVNAATAVDSVVVTLTVDSGITITTPLDVTMTPSIGITADGSIGTVLWNVKTNRTSGYSLAVKASGSPALVSGANSFADYTESTAGTPETWSVASGAKEFGYSAFGTDTTAVTPTWGTGANCGSAGIPLGTLKYAGFKTTDKVVATRSTVTPTAGIDTTVCFAAQQNAVYAASGTYTATITATATEL